MLLQGQLKRFQISPHLHLLNKSSEFDMQQKERNGMEECEVSLLNFQLS